MSHNISQLVQTSAAATSASTPSDQKPFQKPSAFTGKLGGANACQFIAAFSLYAQSQRAVLNRANADGTWARDDGLWIRLALTFMQDDAAVWATLAMEEVAQGRHLYDNSWEEFVKGFKLRFETTDEAADAKEQLHVLFQGKQSVAEYAAKFKEIMLRTSYSSANLYDRFYEHMASHIKDELVHTDRKTETLDQLINVANNLDVRICQREAEKARRPVAAMTMPTIPPPASYPSTASITPFAPPAYDPNAMEVNATKSRLDWTHMMAGKCYGLVIVKQCALTKVSAPSPPEPSSPHSPPPNINNMLAQLNQLSAQFAALKQSF
ncbi:hypothetical protein Moror_7608 [Moniliophthora roreri MCA 2997]|uniref:Retrotransposon gag domain-containing protein n=1 Tax=Moniliophthora roreri (strain MCA 2997) TaxID=1381753 RepID=V2WKB7_MONRO|nr:hypothetical protein Moror_7608 [Moniliophthora roreri MCA 2997]